MIRIFQLLMKMTKIVKRQNALTANDKLQVLKES